MEETTGEDGRTLSWEGTAYGLSSEDESSELIVGGESCVARTLPFNPLGPRLRELERDLLFLAGETASEGGGNVMEGGGKIMEGPWNSLVMSLWCIGGIVPGCTRSVHVTISKVRTRHRL